MLTNIKIVDIKENALCPEVLDLLLLDMTTGKNIIWASDDYQSLGEQYSFHAHIERPLITGENGNVIKPRVEKDKDSQSQRSKDKAEVFTPSWVCNVQNNLVDNAWFGKNRKRFNTEKTASWETNYYPIAFAKKLGKTWEDYVRSVRLEITCGEAPYLTSRYDTVTGKYIPVKMRVGLLDRKLRVISENVDDSQEWIHWATIALQSIYGFEWQGDNILLARENLLLTTVEHFYEKFEEEPLKETLLIFAEIISWNIWQMDGIKFVIPETCHDEEDGQQTLFMDPIVSHCPGCERNDRKRHNGTYPIIKDWTTNETIRFVDFIKEDMQ